MAIEIGQMVEVDFLVSDEIVRNFAQLSGDFNPIHLDEEFARTTKIGRRIAHGMISGSFISSVLANQLPGPGTIYLGQNLKFTNPIYLGEVATVQVKVRTMREDKPIATLETRVFAGSDRRLVVEGEAVVKFA